MRFTLILTIVTTATACGSSREFENPVDPESKSHATFSGVTGSDDPTVTSDSSGLKVDVVSSKSIAAPLQVGETGTNALASISYSPFDGNFYIAKGRVIDTNSGKTISTIERINSAISSSPDHVLSVETPQQIYFGELGSIAATETGILGFIEPWDLNHYVISTGAKEHLVSVSSSSGASTAQKDALEGRPLLFVHKGRAMVYEGHKQMLCNIDSDSSGVISNCKAYQGMLAGCSIRSGDNIGVRSVTSHGSLIAIQVIPDLDPSISDQNICSASIILVNENNVAQKRYSVPKLAISTEDFANGRLISNGETLYFVTMKNDALLFRELSLVN